MIDISSARECCVTWCSFNNTMIFKTTNQMMMDICGFETEIEYLIIAPFYSIVFCHFPNCLSFFQEY